MKEKAVIFTLSLFYFWNIGLYAQSDISHYLSGKTKEKQSYPLLFELTDLADEYALDSVYINSKDGTDNIFRFYYNSDSLIKYFTIDYTDPMYSDFGWKISHLYSDDNKVVAYLQETREQNEWAPAFIDSIFYSGNGKVSGILTYVYNNECWVKIARRMNEYDSLDNLVFEKTELLEDSTWNVSSITERFYSGTLCDSMILTNRLGDDLKHIYKYEYFYNEASLLEDHLVYWIENEEWFPLYNGHRKYNNDSTLAQLLIREYTDKNWTNKYLREFTYNDDRSLSTILNKEYVDNSWAETDDILTFDYPGGMTLGVVGFRADLYYDIITGIDRGNLSIPKDYILYNNFPNPFNPTTKIAYELKESARVSLSVYDIKGELVETIFEGEQNGGHHVRGFNGGRLSSGVYFCRLRVTDIKGKLVYQDEKKMLLLK